MKAQAKANWATLTRIVLLKIKMMQNRERCLESPINSSILELQSGWRVVR